MSGKMEENPAKKAKTSWPYLKIPDGYEGYDPNLFNIPAHYKGDLSRILVPHGLIMDRVRKMAADIFEDFHSQPLTCLCVLKGGHQFFADLVDSLKNMNATTAEPVPLCIDFIRLKSYVDTESSGEVQIIGSDDMSELRGKNVLIVEDMIDTGKTMVRLLKTLEKFEPKRVSVASLFVKRTPRSNNYRPDYVGIEVPDEFVVGYALDYNEIFRDLKHVGVLSPAGIHKYKTV